MLMLFIGGCADGQRLEVGFPPPETFDVPDNSPIADRPLTAIPHRVTRYRRQMISTGYQERTLEEIKDKPQIFWLYVEQSMSTADMIRELLCGYGVPR